jgi:spore coat protein H
MLRALIGTWVAAGWILACSDAVPAGPAASDDAGGATSSGAAGEPAPETQPSGPIGVAESPAVNAPLVPGPEGPLASVDPQVSDAADWVFDEATLRTYALSLDPAVWENLIATATDEVYVLADLEVDGERLPQVGLRFKGSFGTLDACFDDAGDLVCSKLSMKLKFDEADPEQRLYGLKRLNFHAMRTDRSQMHERLGYRLFREMGIPAPRATHARILVNGEYQGVFALVEDIDGRFTHSRFAAGDGNLYKEYWPNGADPLRLTEHLETNEDAPDHSAMLAFYAALDSAAGDALTPVLGQYTDVDQLLSYLAVDRAIRNWDGVTAFYCFGESCDNHNYFFYQAEAEPRFTLIPWDLDNTFGVPDAFDAVPSALDIPEDCSARYEVFSGVAVQAPACDPLLEGLARSDRSRHTAARARLLDGPFTTERMNAWLDAWQAQIEPAVSEDEHGPGLDAFRVAVSHLRDNLSLLRLRALAERDQQPLRRYTLEPGALEDFESTSALEVGLGISRSSTSQTRLRVELGQTAALAGERDLRLEVEFRDGQSPWSQWAQVRVPLAAASDLSDSQSLRLLVRSDSVRSLNIALDSDAYTDVEESGRASWDVELDGSTQEIVLDLASASFSAGGDLVPESLDDVLASVTALLFEPGAEGRSEDGYLGAGVSDSASIQLDEIQFVP